MLPRPPQTTETSATDSPRLISVVLTTYNSPVWLEKVLWGYSCQTHGSFEVIIADDGSDSSTADLIGHMRDETGLRLRHLWQEDAGFRKCRILNRAIEAATGDYLLFSDGDCIPRRDFLSQHQRGAQRGRFLSGGYFKLPMSISQQITAAEIRDGRAFQLAWLRSQGLPLSHRYLRLLAGDRTSLILNQLTTTRPTWNGNNSSGWADDIRRANGFDERMRYGGLDRELGERLENAGVRGKHVRFQTVCLHLDHPRGYANPEDWKRNNAIRNLTRRQNLTRTEYGIVQPAKRAVSAAT